MLCIPQMFTTFTDFDGFEAFRILKDFMDFHILMDFMEFWKTSKNVPLPGSTPPKRFGLVRTVGHWL